MKALIIEDELPSARRLERLLSNYKIEIIEVLTSVKKSIKWFQENKQPDVIFLDIHLSDGLCFEIFKAVSVTSKIIFTTAYSNYSIKAFDYNSISYLLKPIKISDLNKAIQKAENFINTKENLERLQKMFETYETEIYKTSFTVKNGQKIKMIKEEDICCFFSFENATYLKTGVYKYLINHSLTALMSQLNPKLFFRVNRTFIVHKNAIKEILLHSNSRLKLMLHSYNETEIIVSRERVKEFKEFIDFK